MNQNVINYVSYEAVGWILILIHISPTPQEFKTLMLVMLLQLQYMNRPPSKQKNSTETERMHAMRHGY